MCVLVVNKFLFHVKNAETLIQVTSVKAHQALVRKTFEITRSQRLNKGSSECKHRRVDRFLWCLEVVLVAGTHQRCKHRRVDRFLWCLEVVLVAGTRQRFKPEQKFTLRGVWARF